MNSELIVLKALFSREMYLKYIQYINKLNLEPELTTLIKLLSKYFKTYPDKEQTNIEEFQLFFSLKHPTLKNKSMYIELFKTLKDVDVDERIVYEALNQLLERYFVSEIIYKLTPVLEGSEYNLIDEAEDIISDYNHQKILMERNENEIFVTDDLAEILESEVLRPGLTWRLNCLNKDLGELRGGSLGHVFARVDTGKTSFLVSEGTNFAQQLKDDEIVLHVNNEEKGTKVRLRQYQSLLGIDKQTLSTRPVDSIRDEFIRAGGSHLKLYDCATVTVDEIEQLLKEYNVKVLIIDQGDKVKYKGAGDVSLVERLKALYGKFRELAKQYDCDILTAGQASYLAEGKKWFQTDWMDNSKTGKPGELDYAIGIGKLNDNFGTNQESIRYITICKNKMADGNHGRYEVWLDVAIARYTDGCPPSLNKKIAQDLVTSPHTAQLPFFDDATPSSNEQQDRSSSFWGNIFKAVAPVKDSCDGGKCSDNATTT